MMRRTVCVGGVAVSCLLAGLAGGCRSGTGSNIVIKDDSDVRRAEAMRLASDALAAQRSGDKDKALELYRRSLTQSQDLYMVWNNVGLLLMERKDYMQAADAFKTAADLAPTDPKPYYNAGLVYDAAGHSERALEFFSQSLERDPNYLDSLRGAGTSARLLQLADAEALKRTRTALLIEKDPKWRAFFEREQYRIAGRLEQERLLRGEIPKPLSSSPKGVKIDSLSGGQ